MKLGTTFSHRQLQALNCPLDQALELAFSLKFDYLRLCLYWDEISSKRGEEDWSFLEPIITACEKKGQKIILTLGAKAPRYPEYFFPHWLAADASLKETKVQKMLLTFIEKTIKKFADFDCLKIWQIENEPLDPSGPKNQTIPFAYLKKETALVKSLTNKKVLLSLWGNHLSQRNFLPQIESLADLIGLDLYYQQFIRKNKKRNFYQGPKDSEKKLTQLIGKSPKEFWLTELQAEPWEEDWPAYLNPEAKNFPAEKITAFYQRARSLPISTILFWGFEYWFYQAYHYKNQTYLSAIRSIVAQNKSESEN